MARIGEYRFKIYELLYRKPICEYAETVNGRKKMNILILGNGWAGNEAFKASFWAGQYINSDLNITVASQNALEYKKQVLSTSEQAVLPALKHFAESKKYAGLSFLNLRVSDDQTDAGLASLKWNENKYNYIIVCLGDAEYNWLAASEIIARIRNAKETKAVTYNGRIIINVFHEFSDSIDKEDQASLIQEGLAGDIEVCFFGDEPETVNGELERLARNINFSYEMKYDQRVGKKQADEKFEQSRTAEFIQSPHDYDVDDLSIVSNFIGSEYTADSSYACAVHIPCKLAACREYSQEAEAADTLKEAVRTKNTLYRQLAALEHRRWNAYMVMRGYRTPTQKEEEQFLYRGANTNQDKDRLLHICLCDCGEKGPVLGEDFNRQYRLWLEKNCPKNSPSQLDRASLRCHQLTAKLAKRQDHQTIYDFVCGDNPEYINYRQSIEKLWNDEENSLIVYSKALEAAERYASALSEEELEKIKTADRRLTAVKARNARMDFFSLDAQLIEMLLFCLWYGVKYRTVLTISDGAATQDVIIPTLFCAPNAIFIGTDVEKESYRDAVTSYFRGRGQVTVPRFITVPSMDLETLLSSALDPLIRDDELDNTVIHYVPHKNVEVAMALGRRMERCGGKIHIVRYDPNKGILSLSGDKNIGIGLTGKSFSVGEFINLMGGRILNPYDILYDSSEYDFLYDIVKTYLAPQYYRKADGSTASFIPWMAMSQFFGQSAKDDDTLDRSLRISAAEKETLPFLYEGSFSPDIFESCVLKKTFSRLQEYRIISHYREKRTPSSVWVTFQCYDAKLAEILQPFEARSVTPENLLAIRNRQLRFSAMGGLKTTTSFVDSKQLYDSKEQKSWIDLKIQFLKKLQSKGLIHHLSFGEEGRVTFCFKDESTKNLLKKQGTAFELVVYHLLRESGIFDDIETGTKISWDYIDTSYSQLLYEMVNAPENTQYGYRQYAKAREGLLYKPVKRTAQNELDVIAIKGMSPVFISCKTGRDTKLEWLYEISSLSAHFLSSGVVALSADPKKSCEGAFVERAKQMNVSILDTDTLWNREKLSRALQTIADQNIYCSPEKTPAV